MRNRCVRHRATWIVATKLASGWFPEPDSGMYHIRREARKARQSLIEDGEWPNKLRVCKWTSQD